MKENTYSDIYQPANAIYRMFFEISNVCKKIFERQYIFCNIFAES